MKKTPPPAVTLKKESMQVGPTSQGGLPSFVDKTHGYGLSDLKALTFNAVDFNFDGLTDLAILPSYYSRPHFLIFDPVGKKFTPWAHDPLPKDFKASFLAFYDFNQDRIVDLMAAVLNQKSEVSQIPVKLYLGSVTGGVLSFKESDHFPKIMATPTSSLSVIDYDLDGDLDLFIGNWFMGHNGSQIPVADQLFKNTSGVFQDVGFLLKGEATKSADELYPPEARPTFGSSTCDIDQNGYPDILTTSSAGYKNKLWMNLLEQKSEQKSEQRIFEDYGVTSNYASDREGSLLLTGGGRNFFSACADYNNDSVMDIFLGMLTHAYDNESVDKSSILTGTKEQFPPSFIRTEYMSDVINESWNQGDRRAIWFDYNLDGLVDLLVDNSGFPPHSRLVLFEQEKTHAFHNVGPSVGVDIVNPVGSIILDVNRDGVMDILTSQNNIRSQHLPQRVYLFENQKKMTENFSVRVYLDGKESNAQGIGAMVMLYTEEKKTKQKIIQRRWNELSQGGIASQNEAGVHFGVARNFSALGVKVRWPLLSKSGFKSGQIVERMYSLGRFEFNKNLEVTVCEDGRILPGKTSCGF